jgi:hypothetical protein
MMTKGMNRKPLTALVTATVSVAALMISTARATDQGITGKKLLLKSGKFVLLSKDPSISNAGSDPVGGADSSITFNDGSGPVTVALPATLWGANGDATLFKYKNADAPAGPSVAKTAKVKSGLLKAVGKSAPITIPNGPASIDIVFSLAGGTNTYCMTFTGTGDGGKFLVKDALAGTCAGGGVVCGNNVREGSEVCDGSDASACPGNCQADCSCPTQTCGNNMREGTEVCDGSDATACPGNCQVDCTCPINCPATGGDATACLAFADTGDTCHACMAANAPPTALSCSFAVGNSCTTPIFNDACSADVNAYGCGAECCPAGPPPVCGNNLREGLEQCDGSDAVLCPNECLSNCTCAAACPLGGDATACSAVDAFANPACVICASGHGCYTILSLSVCSSARSNSCADDVTNEFCADCLNEAGCASECCN